jgi:hypothetical protein
MKRVSLIVLFMVISIAANATEIPRSVFIHAACDGGISATVLSSLKDGIRTSQKYQLARSLYDEGRTDAVLTIYMNCVERAGVAAIAMTYGQAKCVGSAKCRLSVDGNSIRSALCDVSAAAECGRMLFTAFDDYMSNPLRHR